MGLAPDRHFWVSMVGVLLPLTLGMAPMETLEQADITVGDASYVVELARSWEERQKGLMRRPRLDNDQGLLLVYPRAGDKRIWMKNMLIPIHVYWIDSNYRVVFHRRLEPCQVDPCPVYAGPSSSQFVLELNDSEHDIEIGDVMSGFVY